MKKTSSSKTTTPVLTTVLIVLLGILLIATLVALAFISKSAQGFQVELQASDSPQNIGSRSATVTPFLPEATFTLTLTPTRTRTPLNTPTKTLTSTSLPTSTFSPIPSTPTLEVNSNPPAEIQITGIVGHAQWYSLDCEARSAADWAAFFGTTIDEQVILDSLPKSDNPDVGFVGEYWGIQGQIPPDSYGVHADPIANLLNDKGIPARAVHGMTWEELQSELAAGRPVITWVIFLVENGTPIEYTASDGTTTTVAHYEHTVIITGYDQDRVALLDGSYVYHRTIEQFLRSWSVLGNMAIIYSE